MKSLLLFAISILTFSTAAMAQVIVWPGDVNNNGIVNEVDLLFLGYAFGETGNPRRAASSDWIGQEQVDVWEGSFPDGLNFAFADCNGDGVVDKGDVDVIQTNLNLTHNDVTFFADEILEATEGIDPQFSFLNQNLIVTPGQSVNLAIALGSDAIPVEGLHGVSFGIKVDPRFIQNSQTRFDFNDVAWISPFDNENTNLILEDEANGRTTVSFTTTDRNPVTGGGAIGSFSFVIIEDIIDLLVTEDTLKVEIDSITLVTDDLEKIPIVGASVVLEVEGRTTSVYNPMLDEIKLYPNPTNRRVLLQTNNISVHRIELVNSVGQVAYQKLLTKESFHDLDFQQVPQGLYWIRLITEFGVKSLPLHKK